MSPRHGSRRPRASALVILAAAVLFAACGSSDPSVSPSTSASVTAAPPASPSATASPSQAAPTASGGTPAASGEAATNAIYDAVEAQVQSLRGLAAVRPVPRQLISGDELRTMLTKEFDDETPPAYLAAQERLYKALGLIKPDASLRTLTLDLLSGGVAAFYRDDQGRIYVRSNTGAPGPTERFYFSHEYDHALQDQHFSVFKDQKGILDQSDRIIARQAVYEGDATLTMTQWAAGNLQAGELLQILGASADPEASAALAQAPAILRAPLEFPYTTGFNFVSAAYGQGQWPAVDSLYGRMPASTEQVLHPEKYAANEAPVSVAMPADLAKRLGSGWSVPLQDTFGELQLGIWLQEGGVDQATATAAAAGWGGDRLAVLEGPAGAWAVAMQTAWDTDADATAFETAATTALGKAQGVSRVLPGAGGKTRWVLVADGAGTLQKVAGALGLAG
jgi:hypothetical protein